MNTNKHLYQIAKSDIFCESMMTCDEDINLSQNYAIALPMNPVC